MNTLTQVEEVLSSDEDEIDEQGQEYLENLSKRALNSNAAGGLQVTTNITEDGDDSDSDSDYEPNEETVLETYTTPLDEEECDVDEYLIFKEVMHSK